MRPYLTNKAKAKKGPLRRIRWDERPGVQISFCAHETTHPRHPGDIGDIGDISRKPLKMQGFLNVRAGDISGDIFLDGVIPGDIFWNEDFHAQDTLSCALRWRLDAIGEPLSPRLRTQAEFGLVGTPLVVPANANRFRFGNGSAFPNRRHVGHCRR